VAIKNSHIVNFDNEYFIIQEQYDGIYWCSVEDTYRELN